MVAESQSKQKSRLLILARRFPYSHGEVAAESYLETEIQVLSSRFDEIVAVATEAPANSEITCSLPVNVKPMALGVSNSIADKVIELIQGVALKFVGPAHVKDAFASEGTVGTARKQSFLCYFIARAYRKYARLFRRLEGISFEPTHIYSFWLWDLSLVAVWLKAVFPHAIAFSRAHGYDLYQYRSKINYLPLRNYLLDQLDWIFPCSEDGKAYLNANWPNHERKVQAAYLGTCDLPDKSISPRSGSLRVVSCSRVVPVKRVELIAKAVALLGREGLDVNWVHYGDGDCLESVKSLVDGTPNLHTEFPGYVPNAEVLKEYGKNDFDVFVNASESEGLPISLMEACGIGIPIVATDVGGTKEIVHDGLNGSLVSKNVTPEQLGAAIVNIAAASDERRFLLRHGARRIWEQRFRINDNAGKLADFLLMKCGEMAND